jgi:hypothetical protein
MPDAAPGLEELRARVAAATDAGTAGTTDASALARAALERLDAVLDLIAEGRGTREAGSGLNAASAELLVADALLTEAVAHAAIEGRSLRDLLADLDLDGLSEKAARIDEGSWSPRQTSPS